MFKLVLVQLFISLSSVLASDSENNSLSCTGNVTNFRNELVPLMTYCTAEKPCMVKCCGDNEVLVNSKRPICKNVKEINLNGSNILLDYSALDIYGSDIQNAKIKLNKSYEDFTIVQNRVFVDSPNCSVLWRTEFETFLLENGEFAGYLPNNINPWRIKKALSFCMNLMIRKNKSGFYTKYAYYYNPDVTPTNTPSGKAPKIVFVGVVMLISVFFLILVLLVYSLIPKLRNLSGMLVMVYAATLCVAYFMKAVSLLGPRPHMNTCKVISPILYFLLVSSFIWLNVISFDIWWTFRGLLLRCEINRQGELVKFLWYCLFVWGVTGLMTLAAVLINNADLQNWPNIITPKFETCFYDDASNLYYLYTPIGIITLINILLFLMTFYNIWISERMLNNFKSSNNSKNNKNRFRMYIKMSLLMGTSWAIEVIQSFYDEAMMSTWLYMILNLYNGLIGVSMFFMFVFNRATLSTLCKRFNIQNKFLIKLSLDPKKTVSTQSDCTSSNKGSYTKSRTTDHSDIEMTEVSSTTGKAKDQINVTSF